MELTSLFDEDTKDGNKIKIVRIDDYTSTNVKHAMAVASGQPLNANNDLIDLPAIYENACIKYFSEEILMLRKQNKKFIFICDITNFPYCCCYIDPSDNKFVGDETKFGLDIQNLWDSYDKTRVIMVLVNVHVPFTGLKYVTF